MLNILDQRPRRRNDWLFWYARLIPRPQPKNQFMEASPVSHHYQKRKNQFH